MSLEQNMEEIYQEYSKTVYCFVFCLCHNESLAEELTQETFYWATRYIKSFRNECKISVWLCQIAKNLWFKEVKRMKKFAVISMDAETGEIKSDYDIEEEFIENSEKEELYKQIEKLDGPTKELIYLKLTTGLTFKEIALILGKSETWARVTFYRTKKKLEEMNRKEEQ